MSRILLAVASLAVMLTACRSAPATGLPERVPTGEGPTLTPSPTASPDPGVPITEAAIETLMPPALALPDASGATIICNANALRISLSGASGDRLRVASRIAQHGEWLYLIIDGGLYRANQGNLTSGDLGLEPLLLPGWQVGDRPVQELTDLAIYAAESSIYALDKAGHVFRYDTIRKEASMTFRASPDADEPDGFPYEFTALTVNDEGAVVLLDTAHGTLWSPESIDTLTIVNQSQGYITGSQVTASGDIYYVLDKDNTILTVSSPLGSEVWRGDLGAELLLSMRLSEHLGTPLLITVDGINRDIVGMQPDSGQVVTRHVFAIPDLGMLRDAVFANGHLYALAGNELIVHPGRTNGEDGPCPAPSEATRAIPTLYGQNIGQLNETFAFPIDGGSLPPWPRTHPGAARAYRMGIHHGMDIYGVSVSASFGEGYPVKAIADGEVIRANVTYQEMVEEEFEGLLEAADEAGVTPADILQRLMGRQVIIDHGNGVYTVYSHLNQIAPGIVVGAPVHGGQTIGTVGVSGTQGEVRRGSVGPHLHFEIWINDTYLGYGISLRETMWWYEHIFDDVS